MRLLFAIFCCLCFTFSLLSQEIDPYRYIATLQFDNRYQDYFFNKREQVFPVSFSFNTIQDGNGDGVIDVEDACENIVPMAVGESITGKGRTGLDKRGPNNQRPAVYFHFIQSGGYDVYEYWLYYADNDYLNNHEHDWEKYFVYVKDETPVCVRISCHNRFKQYLWTKLILDNGHPIIGVSGGSHAMNNKGRKGVQIRYNGEINKRKGILESGDGKTCLWEIYSDDMNVKSTIPYSQQPDCFFNGDAIYRNFPLLSKNGERSSCSKAPWKRDEWNNPPLPEK